jgi:hypothetical protein
MVLGWSGSRAAQSCDGCAAVWINTAMSRRFQVNNRRGFSRL